jgi:hypothetical protein
MSIPSEFQDAHIADITGWTFEQIDRTDSKRLDSLLLYKQVKHVAEYGGELLL